MPSSIDIIMDEYIHLGRANGVSDEEARRDIGRARRGQSIFVERTWGGGRGRIVIADNGSKTAMECHDLCRKSGRWYYLAAI